MMLPKTFVYVSVSNFVFMLCAADYATSQPDFFSRMNALANSSLFTVLAANAIVANMFMMWHILTPIFFGFLTLEESVSAQQNFLLYVVEFAVCLLYGEQKVFHIPSLLLVGCSVMGNVWSHVCEARLHYLAQMESSFTRLFKLIQFAIFVVASNNFLTLVLTFLWNAQELSSPGKDESGSHAFYSIMFLHLTLLLLTYFEFTLRLASQECNRLFFSGAHNRSELVYLRRLFRFIESFVFIILAIRTIWKGSHAPILLVRRLVVHFTTLVQTPYDLYKYYQVSRRLQRAPPVTQEELDAEEVMCTICYEQITSPAGTRRLHCSHAFHEACLRQWLEEHSTCPYCRADLLLTPAQPGGPPGMHPAAAAAATGAGAGAAGGVAFTGGAVGVMMGGLPMDGSAAAGTGGDITPEMEEEIRRAYLEYIQSAEMLMTQQTTTATGTPPPTTATDGILRRTTPDGRTSSHADPLGGETLSHDSLLHSSPPPASMEEEENVESMALRWRGRIERERASNPSATGPGGGPGGAPLSSSSTSALPVLSAGRREDVVMGTRVGTMRHLPDTWEAIQETIRLEEEQERIEFRRAAQAIAAAAAQAQQAEKEHHQKALSPESRSKEHAEKQQVAETTTPAASSAEEQAKGRRGEPDYLDAGFLEMLREEMGLEAPARVVPLPLAGKAEDVGIIGEASSSTATAAARSTTETLGGEAGAAGGSFSRREEALQEAQREYMEALREARRRLNERISEIDKAFAASTSSAT